MKQQMDESNGINKSVESYLNYIILAQIIIVDFLFIKTPSTSPNLYIK